jgi:hypothetical protein
LPHLFVSFAAVNHDFRDQRSHEGFQAADGYQIFPIFVKGNQVRGNWRWGRGKAEGELLGERGPAQFFGKLMENPPLTVTPKICA